jgi:hypothetical protein
MNGKQTRFRGKAFSIDHAKSATMDTELNTYNDLSILNTPESGMFAVYNCIGKYLSYCTEPYTLVYVHYRGSRFSKKV